MNRINNVFLFLLAVFAVSACMDNSKQETIHQAEMLMQEQPDSALRVLQTINRHSLRGKTLARYALIYSIAQDKSGLDVTNDSLLRIAYEYYSQHPGDYLYARSQYYMGKYLHLIEQEDSAYACLLKAKAASEKEKDYYTAYLATDGMRRIADLSDSSLCINLAKDAYRLYHKQGANNPVNEVYLLIGVGDGYYRCGNQDSSIHYYNRALSKGEMLGDSVAISSCLQNISRYYLFDKQHEKALDYAKQALSYRGYLDKTLATLLIQCYTENAEYDKAQQYLNALSLSNSKENQLVRLDLQHRINAKICDAEAAQDNFNSAINVAADMYLSTLKEKLELQRKNQNEALERQRSDYRGMTFAICFLFSMVILVLLVWLFLKYRRTSIKEKAYKEHLIGQMRIYVKKLVSIQRKLQEEKGTKNKRLVLDNRDWDEIQAFLDACDNSFVTRFKDKYPNLFVDDYRLCMLLRYGFTNPDLEQIYSITSQGVKNKQRLLKAKLDSEAQEVSLRQYIRKF